MKIDREGKLKKMVVLLFMPFIFGTQCDNSPETSQQSTGVVSEYGHLSLNGIYLTNEKKDTISLEGMSMFWHQWRVGSKYYNFDCMKWLRDDWQCDVIRAAVGVDHGGYIDKPEKTKKKIFGLIEACIDLDLYVIVDWHSHEAESSPDKAIEFFSEVAQRYGEKPNIIYEIYNEPLKVSWSDVVKPYLDTVIKTIRTYDPDNIIIVGSPSWSQDVDEAVKDPILGSNIAYTLHFYSGTHKQWLRDKAIIALENGLPLWVTEFGLCNSDGNGDIDYKESELWFEFMDTYGISWCKWSISNKEETSSTLKSRASKKGNWTSDDLSESGKFIREKIISVNRNTY